MSAILLSVDPVGNCINIQSRRESKFPYRVRGSSVPYIESCKFEDFQDRFGLFNLGELGFEYEKELFQVNAVWSQYINRFICGQVETTQNHGNLIGLNKKRVNPRLISSSHRLVLAFIWGLVSGNFPKAGFHTSFSVEVFAIYSIFTQIEILLKIEILIPRNYASRM